MSATSLGGKRLAAEITARVSAEADSLRQLGVTPTLAVVVATEDESTHWYVRSLAKSAEKSGVRCIVSELGPSASEQRIAEEIQDLSANLGVHGLILQTPLPPGVSSSSLVGLIAPEKDVDGANPLSLGRLVVGERAFAPATARSVVELLDHHGVAIAGRHVAVVGRSAVVGKPLLHLLLERDATVTICHSRSKPLEQFTRGADVVAVAVGKAKMLTDGHVSARSVVIDVGTNVLDDGSLVGDADQSVAAVAAALSPVPGGVGSVTTALLLLHTVEAAAGRAGGSSTEPGLAGAARL